MERQAAITVVVLLTLVSATDTGLFCPFTVDRYYYSSYDQGFQTSDTISDAPGLAADLYGFTGTSPANAESDEYSTIDLYSVPVELTASTSTVSVTTPDDVTLEFSTTAGLSFSCGTEMITNTLDPSVYSYVSHLVLSASHESGTTRLTVYNETYGGTVLYNDTASVCGSWTIPKFLVSGSTHRALDVSKLTMAIWDMDTDVWVRYVQGDYSTNQADSAEYTSSDYGALVSVSDCITTSSHTFESPEATTDYCPDTPANGRTVSCLMPANATSEDDCDANGALTDVCCWVDSTCRASDKLRCEVKGIDNSLNSDVTTTINGVTYSDSNSNEYDYIYPGETVTLSCNGDTKFQGDTTVDSDTQTEITCAVNADGEVTAIAEMYSDITCVDTCQYVTYNSTTQSLSVNVSTDNPQRYSSTITMTCNSGYGTDSGATSSTFKCRGKSASSPSEPESCYRCRIPEPPNNYTTYDRTGSIEPTQVLTMSCADGYNFVPASGETTVTCTSAVYSVDSYLDMSNLATCQKDCPLTIDSSISVPDGSSSTSLAVGSSLSLTCTDSTYDFPIYQSSTITCDTEGEAITPYACQPKCQLDPLTSGTNRKISTRTSTSDAYATPANTVESISYGTMISIACATDYSVKYSEEDDVEVVCNTTYYQNSDDTWKDTVPSCYETCTLSLHDTSGTVEVISGADTSSTITEDSQLAEETVIRVHCDNSSYTVKETIYSYQDLTCTNGRTLTAVTCAPPCTVSEIPDVTNNTVKTPSDVVGQSQYVTFTCPSNYRLGDASTYSTDTGDYLRCSWVDASTEEDTAIDLSDLTDNVIPTSKQCYPYPTLTTAVPDGENMISVTVTLPTDYDDSLAISSLKAIATGTSSTFSCSMSDISASNTCHITADDVESYAVTAQLAYTTPSSLTFSATSSSGDTTSISTFPGPAALSVTGGSVTAVGTASITVLLSDSAVSAAQAVASSTSDYTVTYTLDILDSSDNTLVSKTLTLSSLTNPGQTFSSLTGLSAVTEYTARITSSLSTGSGGSSSMTFSTGYKQPVVTTDVTHSTTNEFTITLGGGATYDGDLDVSIDGTSYTLTFSGGVATKEISGLTALSSYTYVVYVTSASGVQSSSTSVTFTQGPTEPVFGTFTITNEAVTVTWTYTTDNLYHIYVYKQNDDGSTYEDTATASYSTTADDGAISSHTFSSELEAGQTYKVTAQAELTVDGTTSESAVSSQTFQLYACAANDKLSAYNLTYVSGGADLAAGSYLMVDENILFYVVCDSVDGVDYDFVTVDGTYDNVTSCTGPNTWSDHSECAEVTAEVSAADSTGVIVGIIIAIVLILIIIIVIIILIKRRKNSDNNSKKYSPRDEEKNNEVDEGTEAWRNPYYQDNEKKTPVEIPADIPIDIEPPVSEGSPDIPDNKDVPADNVSQEARVDFNEDEEENPYDQEEGVVIPNNNVTHADEKV